MSNSRDFALHALHNATLELIIDEIGVIVDVCHICFHFLHVVSKHVHDKPLLLFLDNSNGFLLFFLVFVG